VRTNKKQFKFKFFLLKIIRNSKKKFIFAAFFHFELQTLGKGVKVGELKAKDNKYPIKIK